MSLKSGYVSRRDCRAEIARASAFQVEMPELVGLHEVLRWADQQSVDHAEHRGVRADAERQREDDREGEARTLDEGPYRKSHILLRMAEPHHSPRFIESLLRSRDVPERAIGSCSGVLRAHAVADQSVRLEFEVRLDFAREVFVVVASAPHGSRPFWPENPANGRRQPSPVPRLGGQLRSSHACQRIEPRPAVVIRSAPLGADPSARFEPLQCGI